MPGKIIPCKTILKILNLKKTVDETYRKNMGKISLNKFLWEKNNHNYY